AEPRRRTRNPGYSRARAAWHAAPRRLAAHLLLSHRVARHAARQSPERETRAMNDREFQSKLGELMAMIETAPESERSRLRELADETKNRHERMRKTVAQLQESLDYLRLSVKYLVFDL